MMEAETADMHRQARDCWELLELGESGSSLLSSLLGELGSADTLILDLWPLELREKTFLLLQATQVVVLCYSSLRKLIHSQA